MMQRRILPLLLAALLVFLSGCGDGVQNDVSVATVLKQASFRVPTDHSLPFPLEDLCRMDGLMSGKLLYTLNLSDQSLDQPPPDLRFHIYDTASRETEEVGQVLWTIAANDNVVFMPNGKAYYSFDDYENESQSMTDGIKIVEMDIQNRTIANRVVMAVDHPLSNLEKISDTEFIYNVGQGVDIRNFSYYIYNTETNTNTLFLTMPFNPETKVGKIPYRARRVGEEIWILAQTVEGEKQTNALEKYSRDGKLIGTLPLPQEISPYIDDDGERYRISDFKVRGNQYYFYSDGTGKKFYYTLTKGKFVAQTSEYGWGTLYPEDDPQYVIYNHLSNRSSLFFLNQQTGETVQCKFQIDNEYNTIRNILFDSSGNSDQVALVCMDKAPLEPNAKNRYQVYFMNFSDVLRAAGLEVS